jgi:hypothetical protein
VKKSYFCKIKNLSTKIMARDIKTTPLIKGKDAIKFYQKLEESNNKKVDTATLHRIEQSVKFFSRDVACNVSTPSKKI